jgi:hypothetical protein
VLAFFSPTSTTYHTTINKVVEAKMVEEKEGGEVMESNNNNRNKLAETKIKSEQKIAFNMGGKHIRYLPSSCYRNGRKFKSTEILLDNQLDVSILHPSTLCNIQPATSKVNINGVRGLQYTVRDTGYLDEFF